MSDINHLRNKMDTVTLEMIKLLKTRTDIAKEIGEVKKNIGKEVTDEEREENLRGKVIQMSKEIKLDEIAVISQFMKPMNPIIVITAYSVAIRGIKTH